MCGQTASASRARSIIDPISSLKNESAPSVFQAEITVSPASAWEMPNTYVSAVTVIASVWLEVHAESPAMRQTSMGSPPRNAGACAAGSAMVSWGESFTVSYLALRD